MAAAIQNQPASGMPGAFAWSAGRNWGSPISKGSANSYLGGNLFYETKNDRGQDREAAELLVDIRGLMSHNALKSMCFIDERWNAGA